MQIDSIKIISHGQTIETAPGKVNFYFGKNGAGKTTLLDGIRYLITGESASDDISVSAVADLTHMSRTKEGGKAVSCTLGGQKTSGTGLSDFICGKMNTDRETVKMQVIPEISMMDPKRMLSVIMNHIPEALNAKKLIAYAKDAGASAEALKLLEGKLEAAPDSFGIDQINSLAVKIHEERLEKTKRLNAVEVLINANTSTEPKRKAEEIEALIAAANDAEPEASYNRRLILYNQAVSAENDRVKKIDRLSGEVAPLLTMVAMTEDEMNAVRHKQRECESKLLDVRKQKATVSANVEILKKTLGILETNVCPISKRLVCTADRTGLSVDIKKALENNDAVLRSMEANEASLEKEYAEAVKEEETENRKRRSSLERDAKLREIDILTKNPITVPEKPVRIESATGLDPDVLKRELVNVRNWEERQRLEAERDALTAATAVMRELETALTKNVKSVILSAYVEVLSDVLNDTVKAFPGYGAKLMTENGSAVLQVKAPGSNEYRSPETLSTGERLIADIAAAVMFNEISKTGVLFIDNVESLDETNLAELKKILEKKKFTDCFDHIFVCGVDHENVKKAVISKGSTIIG